MTAGRARFGRSDLACAAALALVIAGTWCLAYGRTSLEAWRTPISYRGDALFLTAYLRAAHDGHVFPGASIIVPELNAPFGANWNDHPRTLRLTFLLAGLVSRAAGLFVTMNLLLLGAHLLAGLSLFAVARYFRARCEWALVGGLAFGLSHFLFWRSLDHLDLALGWHIPLCILVVTWAFSRHGIALGSRRFLVAAAITAVAAIHNPYYASLYAQFLLFAALAQALRPGARRAALAALALLALLVASFLLDNAGSLAYAWSHGRNLAAARPYGNLERFALKPLELVVPPPGFGLASWGARLGRVHWEQRIYRAEGGSPYLGLIGASALLWLGNVTLVGALRRPPRAAPPTAAAIAWILVYSILGGLNQVAGMLGFVWLRGTNRFSVWILALALLFLVTRAPVGHAGWSRAAALASALLCVADQVPWRGDRGEIMRTRHAVAVDRQLVADIEASLPPRAMLFMLPVVDFPEGQSLIPGDEYAPLRPYLFSHRLRFSFGSDKGRPREAWQRILAAQAPERLARSLESCGFSGILLNRQAYASAAVEVLAELARSGHPVRLASSSGEFVLVPLHPLPGSVFESPACAQAINPPPEATEATLISGPGTRRAGTGPG